MSRKHTDGPAVGGSGVWYKHTDGPAVGGSGVWYKHTDGPAVGGSKCAAAGSKVAGAPLGRCRYVSMDATAKPSFCYGSRLFPMAERFRARAVRQGVHRCHEFKLPTEGRLCGAFLCGSWFFLRFDFW